MNIKKKPLCRFKQKCPDWMAKKDCGFDHVLCKYNQNCKNKQTCMFYHMPKPSFDKPKSQTLCKYPNCSKPGCPFKHERTQQVTPNIRPEFVNTNNRDNAPRGNFGQKICRFDATCFRQDCRFKHPSRQNQGQSNSFKANQPRRQIPQMRVESDNNFSSNQPNSRGLEDRFCLQFLIGNNCQNGQRCQKPHEFTDKGSIKRIFFANIAPQKEFNVLFYEHQKQRESQNKELIYVIQDKEMISFRKLISSQNLYKDFGGIGSNQQNKTYLRSINNHLFKADNVINGIQAFTCSGNQYLVYMTGMMIQIYNTTKGEVDSFSTPQQGNKLRGCVLIPEKGILLVATSQTGVKRFQFNQQRQKFEQRQFNELTVGLKTLKISDTQVLGQKVICGITNSNELVLMNTDLKLMKITFANGAVVNDVDVCFANNKVPVALVSVTFGGRQHQVIGVNLLNLQRETIMQYEFTSGIDKIFTIENHLMIEIKNKGLLVYKMNEFQKQIGMIPLLNQIRQVRKDNKGNLLILQKNSISSQGSISIFKIKRI